MRDWGNELLVPILEHSLGVIMVSDEWLPGRNIAKRALGCGRIFGRPCKSEGWGARHGDVWSCSKHRRSTV